MDHTLISSIRILPNSTSTFPTTEDFKTFIEKTMVQRGGYYFFPNAMMNCPENTLVLFQYVGMIRAYGVMIDRRKETVYDEQGFSYAGYYKFNINYLHYLNAPITREDLQNIYPNFPGFSQSKQIIPLEHLDKLLKMMM